MKELCAIPIYIYICVYIYTYSFRSYARFMWGTAGDSYSNSICQSGDSAVVG